VSDLKKKVLRWIYEPLNRWTLREKKKLHSKALISWCYSPYNTGMFKSNVTNINKWQNLWGMQEMSVFEPSYKSNRGKLRCSWIYNMYRGADKSLARPNWKKTIERSPFFFQRGRHCCCRGLVRRTIFWIVFEWLAKVRVGSL